MRTIEEFKKQAAAKNISQVPIHKCSFCDYQCGYVIRGDVVTYDSGCRCSYGGEHESSWEELAENYNRNQKENNPKISEQWLKETDEFWGFTK